MTLGNSSIGTYLSEAWSLILCDISSEWVENILPQYQYGHFRGEMALPLMFHRINVKVAFVTLPKLSFTFIEALRWYVTCVPLWIQNYIDKTHFDIHNYFKSWCFIGKKRCLVFYTQPICQKYGVLFRLPLCMAVSWSYVRHLVHLFLRINFLLFSLMEFFVSASFIY